LAVKSIKSTNHKGTQS